MIAEKEGGKSKVDRQEKTAEKGSVKFGRSVLGWGGGFGQKQNTEKTQEGKQQQMK